VPSHPRCGLFCSCPQILGSLVSPHGLSVCIAFAFVQVEAIVEKGGDYCIALKGNQKSSLSDARACLAKAGEPT
jgi:hypothetical protein